MKLFKVGLFYLCLSIIKKTQCKKIKEKSNLRKKFIVSEEFIPREARISQRNQKNYINFLQKETGKDKKKGKNSCSVGCERPKETKEEPINMDINLNIEIKNDCCNKNCISKNKSDKPNDPKDKSLCKPEEHSPEHGVEKCDDWEKDSKPGMVNIMGINDPINISTMKSNGYIIRDPQDSGIQNSYGTNNLSSTYELTKTTAINTTSESGTQVNQPYSQGVMGVSVNPVQSNSQINPSIQQEVNPDPTLMGLMMPLTISETSNISTVEGQSNILNSPDSKVINTNVSSSNLEPNQVNTGSAISTTDSTNNTGSANSTTDSTNNTASSNSTTDSTNNTGSTISTSDSTNNTGSAISTSDSTNNTGSAINNDPQIIPVTSTDTSVISKL